MAREAGAFLHIKKSLLNNFHNQLKYNSFHALSHSLVTIDNMRMITLLVEVDAKKLGGNMLLLPYEEAWLVEEHTLPFTKQ